MALVVSTLPFAPVIECGESWGILINFLPFTLYGDEEGPSLLTFNL